LADPLATAAAALPSDPGAATVALVEAWRRHRLPELGRLASRASRLGSADRDKITGVKSGEVHDAWLRIEKAGDPLDVDRLLDTLTTGICAEVKVRLAKVAAWPEDPRVLHALVGIVTTDGQHANQTSVSMRGATQAELPFTSAPNRTFWTALTKWLEDHGDATVVDALRTAPARKLPSHFGTWLGTRLDRLLPACAARVVGPPTSDERSAIDTIDQALGKLEASALGKQGTADALYADVWAHPDDDGPREVLADLLVQNGDPRGEFIVLQLARHRGTLDAAGKKREKELLKRHKKDWLGPIAALIQPAHIRFERGFIVTCSLEPNAALEEKLGTHPAWSTIREFLVHGYAAVTARPLAKMLQAHGATPLDGGYFTCGLE